MRPSWHHEPLHEKQRPPLLRHRNNREVCEERIGGTGELQGYQQDTRDAQVEMTECISEPGRDSMRTQDINVERSELSSAL